MIVLHKNNRDILKEQTGYWNEYYPKMNESLDDVLNREITQLRNPHIFATARALYGIELEANQVDKNIQKVKEFFVNLFGTDQLYVSTVAKKLSILSPYTTCATATEKEIHKIQFPKNVYTLADLEEAGMIVISDQQFTQSKEKEVYSYSRRNYEYGGYSEYE